MTRRTRRAFFGGGVTGFPVLFDVAFNEDTSAPFNAVMPPDVVADDLLIILITVDIGSSAPNATPSGWTQLISGSNYAFYKWADGSEDGASIAIGFSGAANAGFVVLQVRNADTGQSPQATVNAQGTTTNPDPPALDPTWADTNNLFLAYAGLSSDEDTASAYPSGYGLYQETFSGTNVGYAVAGKQSTSSASEDPGTFTTPTSVPAARSYTIAVKGG